MAAMWGFISGGCAQRCVCVCRGGGVPAAAAGIGLQLAAVQVAGNRRKGSGGHCLGGGQVVASNQC